MFDDVMILFTFLRQDDLILTHYVLRRIEKDFTVVCVDYRVQKSCHLWLTSFNADNVVHYKGWTHQR
jgi:hypothetical protein